MNAVEETWAALLTPCGAGAIGVIRVSGPAAVSILTQLFQPAGGGHFSADSLRGQRVRYGRFMDGGEVLDDVLVSLVAPDSTSAIDITAHGGVRILERILFALEARGVRFREAGSEYVAFPCGNRIELESLQALRFVRTPRGAGFLMRQRVALPPRVRAIADRLRALPRDVEIARAAIQSLLTRAPAARALVRGVSIALIGPPNSGKSTLFNRLVGREAAIVSHHPGTTRDWVSAELDIRGLPVTLFDTAGIRVTADELEQSAIAVGQQVAAGNALRLFLWDASDVPREDFAAAWGEMPVPDAVLFNKADQLSTEQEERLVTTGKFLAVPSFVVSARSGIGLDALFEWLLRHVGLDSAWDLTEDAFFTDRQVEAATGALSQAEQNPSAAAEFLRRTLLDLQELHPDH